MTNNKIVACVMTNFIELQPLLQLLSKEIRAYVTTKFHDIAACVMTNFIELQPLLQLLSKKSEPMSQLNSMTLQPVS